MRDEKLIRKLKWKIKFAAWKSWKTAPEIVKIHVRHSGFAVALNIYFVFHKKTFYVPLCCSFEFNDLGDVAIAFLKAYERKKSEYVHFQPPVYEEIVHE